MFTARVQLITGVREPAVQPGLTGLRHQTQEALTKGVPLTEAAVQVTTADPHLLQEVTHPAAQEVPEARAVQDDHHRLLRAEGSERTIY